MDYRRHKVAGGCYFFTVVCHDRRPVFDSADKVEQFLHCYRKIQQRWPWECLALCILPDHLHCLWRLPEGDSNYSNRWRLLKAEFTKTCNMSAPIWQPRFWEHVIRDDVDFENHLNYIHYNPVKHGYVKNVRDWKWSSFHRLVTEGWYPEDWGGDVKIPESVGNE